MLREPVKKKKIVENSTLGLNPPGYPIFVSWSENVTIYQAK